MVYLGEFYDADSADLRDKCESIIHSEILHKINLM